MIASRCAEWMRNRRVSAIALVDESLMQRPVEGRCSQSQIGGEVLFDGPR
jgi:hypothetical protein